LTNSSYPEIVPVSAAGTLGKAVEVPDDGPSCTNYGNPGPVSVISNGNAIVVWYSVGEFDTYSCMAEYFANGTFGPATFVSDGISSVSAQPSEVLTSAGGTLLDWTINSKGVIAAKGSPVTPVTGQVAGAADVVLDPDGSAAITVIIYLDEESESQIWTDTRSTTGTWGTASEMVGSNNDAVAMKMAFAPNGAAIVVWEDWSDSGSPDATYAAIRHAGQPFSSATQIDSLSSDVYTAYAYTTVAAGTDGTLAVVALGMSYTGGYSYSLATAIDVATPAATALGAPTPLAAFSGLFDGTESGVDAVGFTVSQPAYGLALGAGDSTALVGGTVLSTTAQDPSDPSSGGRIVDQTVLGLRITDGDIVTHPLSTLAATYPWSGNPNPPVTDFSGAAIDKSGNGVFAGQLSTSNSDLYYETQSVVAPLTVTTTSLPQGTTGKAYSAKMSASGGTSP
jgi:hypothetical protein